MKAQALLRQATGLDLTDEAVAHAVRRRQRSLGIADPDAYDALLGGAELAELIDEVVVPESWMFRDPEAFKHLLACVQARLARAPGRVVRILSVPCAGGEEPYTIAMAMFEGGVPPGAFRIDAVDVSLAVLQRARAGRFTRNAFRGPAQDFRERYFRFDGAHYHIAETLRSQVNFRQANLLDMAQPAERYDVIFCRNLLIYFDEATVARAIERLAALLADDGMLFAGYAEVPAFVRHGFATLRAPGAFALRKAAAPAGPAAPAPAPPPRPAAVRRPAPQPPVTARQAPAPSGARTLDAIATLLAQVRQLADGGDVAQAAALCEALLAEQPDCAEAYYLLGVVSEPLDRRAAALHYRRCIYLQPDHYEALCHLALLCEHGGDMTQAAVFKQRAARIYTRRTESSK